MNMQNTIKQLKKLRTDAIYGKKNIIMLLLENVNTTEI